MDTLIDTQTVSPDVVRRPRTSEDQEVWSLTLDRISRIMDGSHWHHPSYVENFERFRSLQSRIPDLDSIDAWLREVGWRAVYVSGYVPARDYRALHSSRTIPLTWNIRELRHIDHSAAPDFIHDVLGHLPMLFDENYRALVQEWGLRSRDVEPTADDLDVAHYLSALIAAHERQVVDPEEVRQIGAHLQAAQRRAAAGCSRFFKFETFYTWAIEFGIVADGSAHPKLIGAAALSSVGEMDRMFRGVTEIVPLAQNAVGTAVDYTIYQKQVFKAAGFEEYFAALAAI